MAAPRERIPIFVLDPAGAPRVGASAHVKRRTDGSTVTVYSTETGAPTLTNPGQVIAGSNGRLAGWVTRADLVATVTGGGIVGSEDHEFDAVPAKGAEVAGSQPASPVDGQEWVYEPTPGVKWRFRYNSSGTTYKWEFMGGSAWYVRDLATTTSASSTYSALAGAPSVTIPFAGVYQVEHGFAGGIGTVAVGNRAIQDLFVNGGATANVVNSAALDLTSVGMYAEPTVAGAGQTMQVRQASNSGTSTATFKDRFMRILPARVA